MHWTLKTVVVRFRTWGLAGRNNADEVRSASKDRKDMVVMVEKGAEGMRSAAELAGLMESPGTISQRTKVTLLRRMEGKVRRKNHGSFLACDFRHLEPEQYEYPRDTETGKLTNTRDSDQTSAVWRG